MFNAEKTPVAVGLTEARLHRIFAATPHPYLVLTPDFIIVGANNAYVEVTLTDRTDIVGTHMFDVFPDNPDTPEAKGVHNLGNSLRLVLDPHEPQHMALQCYDVRDANSRFMERHWKPINYPVWEGKQIAHVLHHVENVTDVVAGLKTRQQSIRIDYVDKAKYCGEQATACRSPELRCQWQDMQEQYLRLALQTEA